MTLLMGLVMGASSSWAFNWPSGTGDYLPTNYMGTGAFKPFGDNVTHYEACYKLTAKCMEGRQVVGIYGNLYANKGNVTNIQYWTSTKLPGKGQQCDGAVVNCTDVTTYSNCALFDTPVTIPEGGLYIGMSFDAPTADYVLRRDLPAMRPESNWVRKSINDEWTDFADQYGALQLHAMVKGDNVPAYAARPEKPTKNLNVLAGKDFILPLPITNEGYSRCYGWTISYTIDGGAAQTYTISGSQWSQAISAGLTLDKPIPMAAINEPGKHHVVLTITKAGNSNNTSAGKTVEFDLNVMASGKANIPAGVVEARLFDPKRTATYLGKKSYLGTDVAMKIANPDYVGMKVIGIRVDSLRDNNYVGNYRIWNANALSSNFQKAEEVEVVREGRTIEALFKNPVTLTANGLYLGYSCDPCDAWNSIAQSPAPACGPANVEGSMWMRTGGAWTDVKTSGCATVVVLLQAELKDNGVKSEEITGAKAFLTGQQFNLVCQVQNAGANEVRSLGYSYTIGDVTKTGTVTLSEPLKSGLGVVYTVALPMEAPTTIGNYPVSVTINQVNGAANSYKAQPMTTTLSFASALPIHRPFMEEGTGTECMWCPRGMVAMAEMARRHPDFIGAAYHTYSSTDPMYPHVSLPFSSTSYPCAAIDRGLKMDPYEGTQSTAMGIEVDYNAAAAMPAPASLDLETAWSADKEKLTINATAVFYYVEPKETYKIGYILTTDSLSHPTEKPWQQVNGFAGKGAEYANDPLLYAAAIGTFDVNMFNHVVAEAGAYKGVSSSVPSTVKAGDTVKHSYTYNVPSASTIIERKDLVHVIAVLLGSDGKVRNARMVQAGKTTVADEPSTGISDTTVTSESEAPQYFDLTGRRVAQPQHGLFIKKQGSKATKILL